MLLLFLSFSTHAYCVIPSCLFSHPRITRQTSFFHTSFFHTHRGKLVWYAFSCNFLFSFSWLWKFDARQITPLLIDFISLILFCVVAHFFLSIVSRIYILLSFTHIVITFLSFTHTTQYWYLSFTPNTDLSFTHTTKLNLEEHLCLEIKNNPVILWLQNSPRQINPLLIVFISLYNM